MVGTKPHSLKTHFSQDNIATTSLLGRFLARLFGGPVDYNYSNLPEFDKISVLAASGVGVVLCGVGTGGGG